MKKYDIECADWILSILDGKVKIAKNKYKPGHYKDIPLSVAYEIIIAIKERTEYTGIPKHKLARMVLESVDGFEWAAILDKSPFETRKSLYHVVDNGKVPGMSRKIQEAFKNYLLKDRFEKTDLKRTDPELYKKTELQMRQVAARGIAQCKTVRDLVRLVLDGGKFFGDFAECKNSDKSHIYKTMLDGMQKALNPYIEGAIKSKKDAFQKTLVEMEHVSSYKKIVHSTIEPSYNFWVEGKKIMYYGNFESWPLNMGTLALELFSKELHLDELLETLRRNGITYEDFAGQCRDEVRGGADISILIEKRTDTENGILCEADPREYREYYPEITNRQFDHIWAKSTWMDFEDVGGFIKKEDGALRKYVLELLEYNSFGDYLYDEEIANAIMSDYYSYCSGCLHAFLRAETNKILAGKRYRKKRKKEGKKR